MIQSNELRVGNWVMYSHKHESPLPVAIKIDISDLILIGENLKDYKYEPIVLSPEILEKCGFVYRNEHRGVGCIMDLGNIASVGILENGFRYLLLWQAPLKYLHQLQNIYFAHFGEELTYKQ